MGGGFLGGETALTRSRRAVEAGRVTLPEVVRVMSGAPARTFGLSDRKGAVAPGMDADLVVVDMDREEVLSADRLLSRGKVSVYEGWPVKGAPVMTFVRGHLVAQDGAIVDDTARGRMVRPHMPPAAPRNTSTTMQAVLQPGNVPWDDAQ